MEVSELQTLLTNAFPEAIVQVQSPDGVHFTARLITQEFEGLSRVARHQRVYKALGQRVGEEIHALSMDLVTPAEMEERS